MVFLSTKYAGRTRMEAFTDNKYDFITMRDYADRFIACHNMQLQNDHFGEQRYLGMEGVTLQFFKRDANGNLIRDELNQPILQTHFHSYLSNIKRQDCRTTHLHMVNLLDGLLKNKSLRTGNCKHRSTIWDTVDGCAKQYRSATALVLLSLLADKYKINIDRMVGAPGHGKSWIDALNGVDKTYLKMKMMTTLEVGKIGGMDAAWFEQTYGKGNKKDLRKVCCDFLSDPKRANGVECGTKYASRQAKKKVDLRCYHALAYGGSEGVPVGEGDMIR